MTITVSCFGDFAVRIDGRPVEHWRAGKARELFQYLLLNRGRIIRREKLFETMWPGGVWSPKASSLKVAMHALRRILSGAAGAAGKPPVEIRNQDHGYILQGGDLRLDVDEFEASMKIAKAAEDNGEHARAVSSYGRAVRLYTGDLLATETADWVTPQREYCKSLVLQALSYLRADAVRRDDQPQVIRLCHQILEIDPYYEESYQTLMLIHGRRGELGQVRNCHDLCVKRLNDDLDLTPTDTTQRIFSRAVRGELRSLAG